MRWGWRWIAVAFERTRSCAGAWGLLLLACGPRAIPAMPHAEGERGLASYYGEAFRGRPTASGEPFSPDAMTAAHRTLRFGTWVEVTREDTQARVRVRVNDRGPFVRGRIVDLSFAAARALGMIQQGIVRVELRVVQGP